MRHLLTLFLVLLVAVSFSARPVYGLGGTIQVDGKLLLLEKGFLVTDKTLFVPARPVMKALGGTVAREEGSDRFLLQAAGRSILITPGVDSAEVNGLSVSLSAPAQVKAGELYLPGSFLVMQFGPRLRIDHDALRDPQAVALLTRALQSLPANHDLQTEMQMVLEEPGMLWMAFVSEGMKQVRGEDTLEISSVRGPMGLQEVQGTALKNGFSYLNLEGTWQKVQGDPGLLGAQSMLPIPAPVPVTQADLELELLSMLMVEARLGEQRTEGNTTLQDLHLTLDFSPLLAAMSEAGAGPERGLDGQPMEIDEAMPQMLMEGSEMTLTVDLATGRLVSRQLDLALFMLIPMDEAKILGMRLEVHARDLITPNEKPIAWPEGLK